MIEESNSGDIYPSDMSDLDKSVIALVETGPRTQEEVIAAAKKITNLGPEDGDHAALLAYILNVSCPGIPEDIRRDLRNLTASQRSQHPGGITDQVMDRVTALTGGLESACKASQPTSATITTVPSGLGNRVLELEAGALSRRKTQEMNQRGVAVKITPVTTQSGIELRVSKPTRR